MPSIVGGLSSYGVLLLAGFLEALVLTSAVMSESSDAESMIILHSQKQNNSNTYGCLLEFQHHSNLKPLKQGRKEPIHRNLIRVGENTGFQVQTETTEQSNEFITTNKDKFSVWRREHQNFESDNFLKSMKDQIIMAKIYARLARSKRMMKLNASLMKRIKDCEHLTRDTISDSELYQREGAQRHAKIMARDLQLAKDQLHDCTKVARKLRAMVQTNEEFIDALKMRNSFSLHLAAAKTTPRTLHCLSLYLTTDYYSNGQIIRGRIDNNKLEDPSLYHYSIFSDNVLAASSVVNSTIMHVKEPNEHVFHIVTDSQNFPAMSMWFIAHPPQGAGVHIENIDEFKWLDSSYSPARLQIELLKANHQPFFAAERKHHKYTNPRYLSMLNHLRFYLPQVYPKLNKILFLDDDVIVQKDLTPLWSMDMKGMVNGAVELCKESIQRFDSYLDFSNREISENFDPHACTWAYGMNIFDLKEWKKRNITGRYHHWQELNIKHNLWKLGSLPPGLVTFYNLTYPLDRSWHVLGLGYNPHMDTEEIESAAVIHFNGNYKPWLDLAILRYKQYWSKFINFDDHYLQHCKFQP